jgi:anti-anti-sigma regulatory factor
METERTAAVTLVEREGKRAIVLNGAADIFFAADLRQAALALLEGGEDVAVDCEKLARLDTSTLQILLALKRELEQSGRKLRMIELPSEPARLVGLAGLTSHLIQE